MRIFPVAVIVVGALALGGCAAVDEAATPTPKPTIAPTTAPVVDEPDEPQTVLDGNCSALATEAGVTADLGVAMKFMQPLAAVSAPYLAIPQLGGIRCVWSEASQQGAHVSVVALPSASFVEPASADTECEYVDSCRFGGIVGEVQFFGTVQASVTDKNIEAVAEALRTRFAATLAVAAAPAAYLPADSWPATVPCETLDAGRLISTALGNLAIVAYAYGGDAEPNVGFYVAFRASGLTHCSWYPDGAGASASTEILPGGAWSRTQIAAADGAVAQTIPGFDEAFVVGDALFGISGSNLLELTVRPEGSGLTIADLFPGAAALAAEMDAR